jgi:hypothetical protein
MFLYTSYLPYGVWQRFKPIYLTLAYSSIIRCSWSIFLISENGPIEERRAAYIS